MQVVLSEQAEYMPVVSSRALQEKTSTRPPMQTVGVRKTVDDMKSVNRAEFARLIQEHLADKRIGKERFSESFPDTVKKRAVYHWMAGTMSPVGVSRVALEDVLGWKAGSVKAVLESPEGTRFELSELRDWEKLGEEGPAVVTRASELTNAELLMELTRRFGEMESKLEFFEQHRADLNSSPKAFDLAAHDTDEGRDAEFLEGK